MTDMVMFDMTVDDLKGFGLPVGDAKLFHKEAAKLASSAPASPAPAASAGGGGAAVSSLSPSACDAYTLFLSAYDAAQAPQYPDQLLAAVRETIFAFSRKSAVVESEVHRYFREVQGEALEHKDELLDSIAESAVLIWTSAKRLTLAPGKTTEFCSLLNRILREHDPQLLPSACVVVRGINLLCVMRRDETKLRYPPAANRTAAAACPCSTCHSSSSAKSSACPCSSQPPSTKTWPTSRRV